MIKSWVEVAWTEYNYWLVNKDYRKLKKINDLLKSIERDGVLDGEGLPERLKHYDKAVYSRRIDQEHRLLYTVEDNHIYIFKCKGHYKE
jgi:addiction module toxin, txe/yoeB family